MAKRSYVANCPPVAQVDQLRVLASQVMDGKIAENSKLVATINGKSITAVVPFLETGTAPYFATLNDEKAVELLLRDLVEKWTACEFPEFQEVEATGPFQTELGDWYVDLTSATKGIPFTVTFTVPDPPMDVDTVVQGGPGENAVYKFTIGDNVTGGTLSILWNVGGSVQESDPITYPPTKESIFAAMTSPVDTVFDASNLAVDGSGKTFTLSLQGDLGEQAVSVPIINTFDLTGGGEVFTSVQSVGQSTLTVNDQMNPADLGEISLFTDHTGESGHSWTEVDVQDDNEGDYSPENAASPDFGNNLVFMGYRAGHGYYGTATVQFAKTDEESNPVPEFNRKYINSYNDAADGQAKFAIWYPVGDGNGTGSIGGKNTATEEESRFTPEYTAVARWEDADNHVGARVRFDWDWPEIPSTNPGSFIRFAAGGKFVVELFKVVSGEKTVLDTATVNDQWIADFYMSGWGGANPTFRAQPGGYIYFTMKLSLTGSGIQVQAGWNNSVLANLASSLSGTNTGGKKWGFGYNNDPADNPHSAPVVFFPGYNPKIDYFQVYAGSAANAVQNVWTNCSGGTFSLGYDDDHVVGSVSAVSNLTQFQAKMDALWGAGNTNVSEGSGTPASPWKVEFTGTLAGTDVSQMTGDGTALTGLIGSALTAINPGKPKTYEQWSVAINEATGGTFALTVNSQRTVEIAYGASADTVKEALEDLYGIGSGNVTVTGSGTVADPYLITLSGSQYLGVNVRQMIGHNELLIGTGYPEFTYDTITPSAGPWHWNQKLNWINADTGEYGLPQNGDSLYFELGDQSRCPKYDLDQSALTVIGIYILGGFTDNAVIGLPRWNPSGYWEYRPTELKIKLSGDGPIFVGSRGQGGSPLLNINTLDTQATMTIYGTSAPMNGEVSAFQFQGTHAENSLTLYGGFFGAAVYAGQTATLASLTQVEGSFLSGEGASIGPIHKVSGSLLFDRTTVNGILSIQG